MKKYCNTDKAYLLMGDDLNKIINCLMALQARNMENEGLNEFIKSLINLRCYDDMIDQFILKKPIDLNTMLKTAGITLLDK